jgi:hypothetical protein
VMQCMAAEGVHRHVTWRTNEFVPGSALTCARLPHEQSGSWPVARQGQHSRSAAYFNTSDLGSATMTRNLAAPHPTLSGRCNSAYTCDACSAWQHHWYVVHRAAHLAFWAVLRGCEEGQLGC